MDLNGAGHRMRKLMETHEFVAANTVGSEIKSTFFGNSGGSQIDSVASDAHCSGIVSCSSPARR
eukprot:2447899-Pyramimonas_sp.AAC.1